MSFHSPFPDVEIPDTSLFDFLFGKVAEDEALAARPALVDGTSGAVTTYGQLVGQVNALAGGLAQRGFHQGDVAGLLCPNVPAFATVFHGILRAGGTATTINSLYTAGEIASQLSDAKAKYLFTISLFLPQADDAAATVGIAPENVVLIDGSPDVHPDRTSLRELLSTGAPPPQVELDPATHVAVLPYSSGTTGRAKGVMLSHRNLVANVEQSGSMIRLTSDDKVLAVLPFFHIYGMSVLMNSSLARGATVVTLPRFDLADFLRVIAEQQCTYVFIAPPVAVALAKHPMVEEHDTSSIKVVFSGAAPLDAELGHKVAERLGCEVRQGYGMSEMSPVSHSMPDDRDDVPLGTVGLTLPNMECKIVDADGTEIEVPAEGTSAPGELWCKGPNIMLGYLENPEATAVTLDEDGFLHTGDVATVSAEGYVTIVDRVKELIKYKGYQVPPAELEALLLTHDKIADAACIGVTDAEGEEVPKAFVVRQPGAELSAEEVMDFVASKVAPYKKVRQVEFLEAIPKSAAGKILRKDLRAKQAAV
ncbi:AMP-binding protein [Rhodococcus sp. X156]|uniref:AMP-binding protein n=1 Tax=Rhodococcus sp. X156 TaxID=2499145 RepID=UPI000FDC7436|nr:AMP-binding protein [Rhodococcus sp. X156]